MMIMRMGHRTIVGLTKKNIEKLMAGEPLHFGNSPLTFQQTPLGSVAFVYGETKPDILRAFEASGVEVLQTYHDAAARDPL